MVDPPLSRTQVAQAGSYGRPGQELLPLLARQRAVRERAGTLCPRLRVEVPDGPLAVAVRHQQTASVGGQVEHRLTAADPEPRADLSARCNVPEGREGGAAGDGEHPAVGAEVERPHRIAHVLLELSDELAGADVPEVHEGVAAAGRERAAVWTEGDSPAEDVGGVDGQRRDERPAGHIPDLCVSSPRLEVPIDNERDEGSVGLKATSPALRLFPMWPSGAPVATSQSSTPPPPAVASIVPSALILTPTA